MPTLSPQEIELIKRFFLLVLLILARLYPISRIVPFFGGRQLGMLVKNAIILCLALFLYPMIEAGAPAELSFSWHLMLLAAKEIVLGFILAVLASIFFWAAEGAGKVLDEQREIMSASKTDPLTGEATSPLGTLLAHLGVIYFITAGGLLVFLNTLFESYQLWPVFSYFPDFSRSVFASFSAAQLGLVVKTVLVLAGPMAIVCFFSDFGLGLVARGAPQLNAYSLSMPIKSGMIAVILIFYVSGIYYELVVENAGLRGDILHFLAGILHE